MERIIISDSFNPYFNLAFENLLFTDSKIEENNPRLYLWRNSDVVVIGRFQNPWKECNIQKLQDDNVFLMRRDTGGGAVYHDTDNLCFTFVGSTNDGNYRQKNSQLICDALALLGFNTISSGRNDLTIDDKKISGAAFREKDGKYIHHGTILVGTDLTKLAKYLNPNKMKLMSKGISSVRSRVTKLQDLNSAINIENVIDAIIKTYCKEYSHDSKKISLAQETLLTEHMDLNTEYNRLKSWDWIYGKSPEFTHCFEGRFDWGGIEINFLIKNAIIEDITIHSDCLDIEFITQLKNHLTGLIKTEYNIFKIHEFLSKDFAEIATLFK